MTDRPQPTASANPAPAPQGPAASQPPAGDPAMPREARGSVVDRRGGLDRRRADLGSPTGLERRRGPGRRLSEFTKSAEEGEMTTEQFLFLMAIESFKKANNRMFPSWTDVLEVIRLLGYRKTMPSEIRLNNADDWREAPDTPANVRPRRRDDDDHISLAQAA